MMLFRTTEGNGFIDHLNARMPVLYLRPVRPEGWTIWWM
jgi:hypothetical protein